MFGEAIPTARGDWTIVFLASNEDLGIRRSEGSTSNPSSEVASISLGSQSLSPAWGMLYRTIILSAMR